VTYLHALVLGVVQGLTEFLPVSSSGHLILVPRFLGWPDQGLAFDAAMHLGTIAALLAYFRTELRDLATGALSRRLVLLLVLASVPAGLVGLLFDELVARYFRSPLLVAGSTAFWGLVMLVADRRAPPPTADAGDPLERVTAAPAMTIGVAQAVALIPGTSRSGITITAGIFSGLDRATAARFSFLLGIPITGAAGLLKAMHLVKAGIGGHEVGVLVAGVLAAFASGWFAVWFLVSYLKRRSLLPFVVYRLTLAALILLVFLG
jgi:undecaprenyl-diphosphatase